MNLDFSFDQTFDDTFSQHFIAQSADNHCLGYISTVNWLYHTLPHSLYVGCSTCSNKSSLAHALSDVWRRCWKASSKYWSVSNLFELLVVTVIPLSVFLFFLIFFIFFKYICSTIGLPWYILLLASIPGQWVNVWMATCWIWIVMLGKNCLSLVPLVTRSLVKSWWWSIFSEACLCTQSAGKP